MNRGWEQRERSQGSTLQIFFIYFFCCWWWGLPTETIWKPMCRTKYRSARWPHFCCLDSWLDRKHVRSDGRTTAAAASALTVFWPVCVCITALLLLLLLLLLGGPGEEAGQQMAGLYPSACDEWSMMSFLALTGTRVCIHKETLSLLGLNGRSAFDFFTVHMTCLKWSWIYVLVENV